MSKKDTTLEAWLTKARRGTSTTNPLAPELIAGKVLKLNKTEIALSSQQIKLTQKNLLKLNNLLGKALSGRPLAAVLHHTQFHKISLKVNGKALSPRAETEELVEYAIKNIPKNTSVFDIGTGTGAIGLALAKDRPDLGITLTDLTNTTLNLAKLNARKNKITSVKFTKSDLIKNIDQKNLEGAFFLANLPYVNPNWKGLKHKNLKHEPRSALFANDNGLRIIKNLLDQITNRKLLTKGNWILLEHDPKQYQGLNEYCKELGLATSKISDFVTSVSLK